MQTYMNVKILLPHMVFAKLEQVTRIVAETTDGSYGFLPNRLDCSAKLRPGIFVYESPEGGEQYVALDEGILVKKGREVVISSRNAVGGADLGKLHEAVEKDFESLNENEENIRQVMKKLETNLVKTIDKMKKERG
jgi:F-type H+-transporting ATPase subunit epsilon